MFCIKYNHEKFEPISTKKLYFFSKSLPILKISSLSFLKCIVDINMIYVQSGIFVCVEKTRQVSISHFINQIFLYAKHMSEISI